MSLSTQDYIDIQMLYARYNHAIDAGKAEAWAATFTPDGDFKATGNPDCHGTAQLAAFAQGFAGNMQGKARHWTNNLVIEPSPEGAKGSCYLILYRVVGAGTPPAALATGIYRDVLTKAADGWKFASRTAAIDA
ncbi:MAG: nuclear transport factor 2 family protein [Chloroflexi bacterium]|nr:nuclear transport factor 2 family protein [Chloroflexota bacterium]